MAKKVVSRRWSYAEDRRLIQLTASSKSVKAIADEMNRAPERVVQMAKRLGISLNSAAKRGWPNEPVNTDAAAVDCRRARET
jgi:hypothetical protein